MYYTTTMENFYYNSEIEYISEVLKNRLYFGVLAGNSNKILRSTPETLYFSIDDELVYINYYFDFGPLNISCLYKYCCKLNSFLCMQGVKRIVHYTSSDGNKRSNSAYLMGSFAVIYLKMDPRDVYKILLNAGGVYRNFVDASQGLSQYTIRLTDCLQAMTKAVAFKFFNFADFNITEYDMLDKLQNGDMNWLIPRKFLAFIGPNDNEILNGHPPDFYLKYFLKNDIKTVIRLNNKTYDSTVINNAETDDPIARPFSELIQFLLNSFSQVGINHHELFFPDGTTPPKDILLKFLNIAENAPAAIAVHCKAGLGRTGSLIGAYIVKHYRMTAREAIAWLRICRPGSVIGQQQGWLEKIESWLWRQGSQYRVRHYGEGDKIPHHRFGIYSIEWPKERERLIRIANKKKIEVYSRKNANLKLTETERLNSAEKKLVLGENANPARHHVFEKRKILLDKKENDFKRISKLLSRVHDLHSDNNKSSGSITVLTTVRNEGFNAKESQENVKPKWKQSKSIFNSDSESSKLDAFRQVQNCSNQTGKKNSNVLNKPTTPSYNTNNAFNRMEYSLNENRTNDFPLKRNVQSQVNGRVFSANRRRISSASTADELPDKEAKPRRRIPRLQNTEVSQGDKLNEIKAQRYLHSTGNYKKSIADDIYDRVQ